MGVTKCIKCRGYFDEEEIVWISVDRNHDASYCVECSPDDNYDKDEDTYDPDSDSNLTDEE
jgi:hypothetical protein